MLVLTGKNVATPVSSSATPIPVMAEPKKIGYSLASWIWRIVLPAPVPSLTEPLLWELRAVYDELVQTRADVAPYVAVIAMNRLARPCEALRLP